MPLVSGRWVLILGVAVLGLTSPLGAQGFVVDVPDFSSENLPAVSPREREHMMDLAKAALGPDEAASAAAIKELLALGEGAKPRLASVIRELLTRDRTLIGGAGRRLGPPEKAKALLDEITAVRAGAIENIARLDKGDRMRIAHENYDKLARLQAQMSEVYGVRCAVRAAMVRRPRLMAVWQQLGQTDDLRITPANEDKTRADAEAVLGMPIDKALAIPQFGQGKEPANPAARQLWFLDACRRIEAWNRALAGQMSAGELENLNLLNAYRESLGTMPLEVDARLLQSARRHSKEMVEKGYFAHESPTPGQKTHIDRMKNAGYNDGYSENIAGGSPSGKMAFWQWFGSPPHHQNMVNAGSTGFGVGQWGSTWTQNFGGGKRLMLMDPAERARQVVKGALVAPQGAR